MRIAYLHQYFKIPTENGGTRSYDLATSFIKEGHSVDMITTTSVKPIEKGNKWRAEDVNGIKVHYLYLPYDNSFSFIKRGWIFFQFIFYSFYKLFSLKIDVVLATSTPLTIGIPALLKKFFHKTPYIFETRDIWPEAVVAIGAIKNSFLIKVLEKLEFIIYKNAKFIVPLSVDMEKSIINRYPFFQPKIKHVIENIAEIDRFSKCPDINRNGNFLDKIGFKPKISVLYAGTFGKVNNIKYLIDLANKIYYKDPEIVFFLLGEGSEKEGLIKYSEEIGVLYKNVFFLPAVGKGDLPIIYRDTTIGSSFVAPIKELWANSANKFFDTLAAGKPILINHEGWQAELIREERIGYVLDSDLEKVDIIDFIRFLNDSETLNDYGIRARALASEKFSLRVATSKYNSILRLI